MKSLHLTKKLILISLGLYLFCQTGFGQANASINVLTQNSGLVGIGNTIYIQVDVGNTGPASNIGVNKVRAQISVPSAIVTISPNAQQDGLPAGWSILTNTGSAITVCNGTDIIPVGTVRTVLIKVQGVAVGGPSTVTGVLSFGPGTAVCTGPGSLSGDITADNTSNSSIQASVVAPVTLTDFHIVLLDCQPTLRWTTTSEYNAANFVVERSRAGENNWLTIATIPARNQSASTSEYNHTDISLNGADGAWLYRLKMVDRDGRFRYSEVLSVLPNCKTPQVLTYPNPVKSKLYMSLTGISGKARVMLLTSTGQTVLQTSLANGISTIDVSSVTPGLYVLSVKDENGFDKKIKLLIGN